jgi:hypothetical protein
MWNISRAILLFLLIGIYSTAQTATAGSGVVSQIGWLDHWRSASFSFGQVEKDDQGLDYFKVIGTGIMIALDEHHGWIVTAKHVFYDPGRGWHPAEIRVRYAWEEKKSVYDDLGTVLKLQDENNKDLWLSPEDGSDVAVITPIAQPILGVKTQDAIFVTEFAKDQDIFEGESVVVLGYPGIVGNDYLVRAISRGGIVSWLEPTSPFDKPFLVDSNIYPGNSGGPVIKSPSGSTKEGGFGIGRAVLLGIVSKAPFQGSDITLQVPGQILPLKLHQDVPLGGTGIIVPAAEILHFLSSIVPK